MLGDNPNYWTRKNRSYAMVVTGVMAMRRVTVKRAAVTVAAVRWQFCLNFE